MPEQDPETARWFANDVTPHEASLRRYLCGLVEVSNIDDLVQEIYSRLLHVRRSGEVRSVRGLLFAIARNAVRDLSRRSAVAKTTAVAEIEDLNVLDSGPGVSEIVSRRQETELLQAAILSLPERCRAVLMLRKFENLTHKEIAERLGIAEHTVEAQLTKAFHRCEDYFRKHGAL